MRYLLWYGEKAIAVDAPTEQEFELFKEARQTTLSLAHKIMRLKPEDYAYTSGKGYNEI